jgi:hypothetical protein
MSTRSDDAAGLPRHTASYGGSWMTRLMTNRRALAEMAEASGGGISDPSQTVGTARVHAVD